MSCVVVGAAAFATIDYAQQAWLFLPVGLVLLGLLTLPVRLHHRRARVSIVNRAALAAPPLLLLPHLPLAAPDLPGDLGVPRAILIAVPAAAAALLIGRALRLPAGWLLPARVTGAWVLTTLLALNLATYHGWIPTNDGIVEMEMPLDGEWMALQAGRSLVTNHHTLAGAQNYAVDFVRRLPGGKTWAGDREQLDDYAAYSELVVAPVAGRVERVRDGLPDQQIGGSDPQNPSGNHVILRVGPKRLVLLAHLRPNSIRVSEGQKVRVQGLGKVDLPVT